MIPATTAFCICDFETTGVDTDKDYPIEIGCIFTDRTFSTLGIYQDLISWPDLMVSGDSIDPDWNEHDQQAANIHKISYETYINGAVPLSTVVGNVKDIVDKILNKFYKRVILISDNIQFEYRFMSILFKEANIEWPFHYCGWDSSLLLELTNIGDPVPDHRALRDCALLQRQLIRATEKIGAYRN